MGSIEILIFLMEFIGVSAILYLVYILFLRYKCRYNFTRAYLLLIPIVALLGASSSFNVIPVPEKVQSMGGENPKVQQIKNLVIDLVDNTNESTSQVVVPTTMPINFEPQVQIKPLVIQEQDTNINGLLNVASILGALYILVILIRTFIVGHQVQKIRSIKRWATRENCNGIELHRSALVETPFSFMRDIFVNRAAQGDKLNMIIQHELSHISNRHYLDKNVSELMCVFMWFNPIVWLVRNELGSIHEFQADNNVIKNGANIKTYQIYLFEEILSKSPIIANGFNHSLIKKRMIMMKDKKTFKYFALRASIATVSLVGAFVLVSFKHVEADNSPKDKVSENSSEKVSDTQSISNDGEMYVKLADASTKDDKNEKSTTFKLYTTSAPKDSVFPAELIVKDNETPKDNAATSSKNNKAAAEQFFTTYTISDSLKKKYPQARLRYKFVPEDTSKETLTYYVEDKSGDLNKISVIVPSSNNLAINILYNKNNSNSKTVVVTGDTRPSDKDIATLVEIFGRPDMIGDPVSELISTHLLKKDGIQRESRDIKMPTHKGKVTTPVKSRYDDPEKYYTLSDAQINAVPDYMKYVKTNKWGSYGENIIGIEVTENETLVDLVLRPSYDVYWWCLSQNTCLVDTKTGKQYKIKGIKGGMPLEELLIVKGYKDRDICFTLIFEPLDPGVNRLDFIEKAYETLVPPSNGSPMLILNLDAKKLQRRKISGTTSTTQTFNGNTSQDYTLREDQINGLPDYIVFDKDSKHRYPIFSPLLHERAIGIENKETETLVDFVITPSNNMYWFGVSENTYLMDYKTENRYKIRGIKNDIPLGQGLVVKDQKNKSICLTLIFPPLGEKVKKVDLIELVSETIISPTDGVQLFHNRNLNVKDLVDTKNKMGKIIK